MPVVMTPLLAVGVVLFFSLAQYAAAVGQPYYNGRDATVRISIVFVA